LSNETFWVNGEPFALIESTNPLIPKPNTELYWFNGESCFEIEQLAAGPYTPPYVPPTPTPSPYGAETYWYDGMPSEQIFPIDFVPPTFAGISSLTLGSFGQLIASWPAAIDPSTPVSYEVYIQAGTATGLFNSANITLKTTQLTGSIFTLPNGSLITNATYYVGVRALDLFGNSDSNTVSLSYVNSGPSFAGIASLTVGSYGQFYATWAAASVPSTNIQYEVYIQPTSSVGLFNTSNIVLVTTQLNAEIFNEANGSLIQPGTYYVGVRAKNAIEVLETNTVSLSATTSGLSISTALQIDGTFNINNQNQLIATFWATDNNVVLPPRLGTASYVIYDENGSLVSGMSESGIVADANGLFKITPVSSVLDFNDSLYIAKITTSVDATPVVYNLPIKYTDQYPSYEPRAVFSINAYNQLQGTLWITKDGELIPTSELGVASYTIYDKDGISIGITESGITADANGYFEITPVSAASITDLTHYIVKITIQANNVNRIGTVGITLGE
jgi:hypothetical protein